MSVGSAERGQDTPIADTLQLYRIPLQGAIDFSRCFDDILGHVSSRCP